jgi:hypothetical protein
MRCTHLRNLLIVCPLMLCLGPLSATDSATPLPERFSGHGVDLRRPRGYYGRAVLYEIVVERWSTQEEFDRIVSVMETRGQGGLLAALATIRAQAGFARAVSRGLPNLRFKCAFQTLNKDGRRIMMLGDGPPNSNSPLEAAEVQIGPDGKKTAWLWPGTDSHVVVSRDKTKLEIEHESDEMIALTIKTP